MASNYQQQSLLSLDDGFKDLNYFSEFDAKTGFFNACLHKNNKAYLIAYLNALIHDLLKAVKEGTYEIGVFEKEIKHLPSIQLVRFNIGDMLRSKCYSREK